tara:strand:+ start:1038 stop:1955 length:918 start_codon:yes stop_codon:yes gene_type:complete
MRLHGFTRSDVTEGFDAYVTNPPGLFFYRDVGVAIFTWHELRAAVGFDFGDKPVTTHYATVEDFLHHEMPTFDMTEPSEEEYPDPKKRAEKWTKKKRAARRRFYDDVDKLAAVGLAHRDANGDVHLGMGARGDEIVADRARRKAKRQARRGEVPVTETVAPAPKKAAPKALAESTAPAIDVTHEEVQADVAPMRDKEADALHFNSEAKLRGQRHRAKELAKQIYREEAGLRAWEERTRLAEEEKEAQESEPSVEEEPVAEEATDEMSFFERREAELQAEIAAENAVEKPDPWVTEPVYINGEEQW